MYYEINVAKKRPMIHGVDGGYGHLFATAPRSCDSEQKAKELALLLRKKFPKPEYNITMTYHPEVGQFLDLDTFVAKPEHLLLEMLDIEKCKKWIQDCPKDDAVILISNWSINRPKYKQEEYEEGIDQDDWEEVEKALGLSLQVNQFDDLIVDPHGLFSE